MPLIELRLVGDDGTEQPWDGKAMGEVQPRAVGGLDVLQRRARHRAVGLGVAADRRRGRDHSEGYLQLVDRAKDLVKSGGEWISSVDLEGAIMGHPKVLEAAVIGVAQSEAAGEAARVRGGEARRGAHEGGSALVPGGKGGQVVASRRRRVPRGDPEDERRQVLEEGAPRPVRGLQAAYGIGGLLRQSAVRVPLASQHPDRSRQAIPDSNAGTKGGTSLEPWFGCLASEAASRARGPSR
jgi:hypothetical protein